MKNLSTFFTPLFGDLKKQTSPSEFPLFLDKRNDFSSLDKRSDFENFAVAAVQHLFDKDIHTPQKPDDAVPAPDGDVLVGAAIPTDPLLTNQWYLGATSPILDLGVRAVWDRVNGTSYSGAGTRTVVIDDGFDYTHPDLSSNFNTSYDYDYSTSSGDSFGNASNIHGTPVIGIIGADNNGTGTVGVAFDTNIVGYRVTSTINDTMLINVSDAIRGAALSAEGDVINLSLALSNLTTSYYGNGFTALRFDDIESSIQNAITNGRDGLGSTIVKAAGNARAASYDINADDWANDTRQVIVAAVENTGFVSTFSSYGAALLVSALGNAVPTSGTIATTDRTGSDGFDNGNYVYSYGGTSAAAAMVSGVVALMYEANPNLGWRDVQNILAYSASHVGSSIGGSAGGDERYLWQWNAARTWNGGGLHYSNDYGYGLVNAEAAVRLAETWLLTANAPQVLTNEYNISMDMVNSATIIPDNNLGGVTFTGSASFADVLERVTVTMTFSTTFIGDLRLYITSPSGTRIELMKDTGGTLNFNGTWTFETQAFRGEYANGGNWQVQVIDDSVGDTLTVSDLVVKTYGSSTASDRYIFTNAYSDYVSSAGHLALFSDTNNGSDTINVAAVSSASVIRLTQGENSIIDGVPTYMNIGTIIENAIGGDFNDEIFGNTSHNALHGRGGADWLYGGSGDDTLYGGFNNDLLFGGQGLNDTAAFTQNRADVFIRTYNSGGQLVTSFGLAAGETDLSVEVELGAFNGVTHRINGAQANHISNVSAGRFDDVIFHNNATGQSYGYIVNSSAPGTFAASGALSTTFGAAWKAIDTGDMNSDGRADVIYQNNSTGAIAFGLMSGAGVAATPTVTASLTSAVRLVGTADTDGDGWLDLIVQNMSDGIVYFGDMTNTTLNSWTAISNQGLNWQALALGDVNGDGRADVVYQHSTTGAISAGLTSQTGALSSFLSITGGSTLGWTLREVADVKRDGYADVIIQRNSNGDVSYVNMLNGTPSGFGTMVNGLSSAWRLDGVADTNNDGDLDGILRNTSGSGDTFIVNMENGNFTSFTQVALGIGADWYVV